MQNVIPGDTANDDDVDIEKYLEGEDTMMHNQEGGEDDEIEALWQEFDSSWENDMKAERNYYSSVQYAVIVVLSDEDFVEDTKSERCIFPILSRWWSSLSKMTDLLPLSI